VPFNFFRHPVSRLVEASSEASRINLTDARTFVFDAPLLRFPSDLVVCSAELHPLSEEIFFVARLQHAPVFHHHARLPREARIRAAPSMAIKPQPVLPSSEIPEVPLLVRGIGNARHDIHPWSIFRLFDAVMLSREFSQLGLQGPNFPVEHFQRPCARSGPD
jgi:hypothetical protein